MNEKTAAEVQFRLIGEEVKQTLDLLTGEQAAINDIRVKIQEINKISEEIEKGSEFKKIELCKRLQDLRYGLEGVMYNYVECARKIESLSDTILTTPESLKILAGFER